MRYLVPLVLILPRRSPNGGHRDCGGLLPHWRCHLLEVREQVKQFLPCKRTRKDGTGEYGFPD